MILWLLPCAMALMLGLAGFVTGTRIVFTAPPEQKCIGSSMQIDSVLVVLLGVGLALVAKLFA